MQRKNAVYICSTYNKNSKLCPTRVAIKESELEYIINKHILIFELGRPNKIEDVVRKIEVGESGYRIYYSDGRESIVENDRFKI